MTKNINAAGEYSKEQFRNMAKQLKWKGTEDGLLKGLKILHRKIVPKEIREKLKAIHESTTKKKS